MIISIIFQQKIIIMAIGHEIIWLLGGTCLKHLRIIWLKIRYKSSISFCIISSVFLESRCSIKSSLIRIAICLSIVGILFPDMSAMSLPKIPGLELIIVYVVITLSFNPSFIVSFASLFPLLGIGSTYSTSSTNCVKLFPYKALCIF